MTRVRTALLVGGVALILAGVFVPREWYDRLPRNPGLPAPPISGLALLQITLVAEGLVLLWLSRRARTLDLPAEARRIVLPAAREADEAISRRTALVWLGAVTVAGLAL